MLEMSRKERSTPKKTGLAGLLRLQNRLGLPWFEPVFNEIKWDGWPEEKHNAEPDISCCAAGKLSEKDIFEYDKK